MTTTSPTQPTVALALRPQDAGYIVQTLNDRIEELREYHNDCDESQSVLDEINRVRELVANIQAQTRRAEPEFDTTGGIDADSRFERTQDAAN